MLFAAFAFKLKKWYQLAVLKVRCERNGQVFGISMEKNLAAIAAEFPVPFGASFSWDFFIKAETGLNLRHSLPGFPAIVLKKSSEFHQNMAAIVTELPAPFGAFFQWIC